ncbi:MAG: aminoglycoside phosphotransferase family protein [Rhabdochlamydiaceae bacterium]
MSAIKCGMDRVVITFVDPNSNKPDRSDDRIRLKLLHKLFESCAQVLISEKKFQVTLLDLLDDPNINKVHIVIGADLLPVKFKSMAKSDKLGCFVISRDSRPLDPFPPLWNGLPTRLANLENLIDRHTSSTIIKRSLAQNELSIAKKALTTPLLEMILSEGLYPTLLKSEVDKLVKDSDKPILFQLNNQGISGDLVFFVKNKNGKCILVVKVFADLKCFHAEIAAYQKLSSFQFTYVRVPRIHYADKHAIVMDFIEGIPLSELMQSCPEAIKLCAKANVELHLAQTTRAEIPKNFHCAILDEIAAYSPKVVEQLWPKWNKLREDFLRNPGLQSMTHGDPNHFNWIVDVKNQIVTYVDLSNFSQNGFAMNEFYEAHLCFWTAAKRVGGIEKEQLQKIRKIYEEAYFENISQAIATFEARAFFKAYWELKIIQTLLSQGQNPEKEVSEFLSNQ